MSSRIPPLLEPYLALPPEASLILLTSVLGASSNWLVLRFLYSALISPDASSEIRGEDEAKVLLVSFMRDVTFWKENAKRLVGSISALESCLFMFVFQTF
jgi:elongator complex protein 6